MLRYLILHYFNDALVAVSLFNVALIDAVILDVKLFSVALVNAALC